jgi:hypothetical protein
MPSTALPIFSKLWQSLNLFESCSISIIHRFDQKLRSYVSPNLISKSIPLALLNLL